MGFTNEQKQALAADLHRAAVKSRSQAGRSLSYIEGWHAIAEANRIFGFDAWTRETTELRVVAERERKIGKDDRARDGWAVSYIAKVRVTVFAGDTLITREGAGCGHGIDVDLGLAHESAAKEAETDAMKRAMMTFGNPFGLALYDKEQSHVSDAPPAATIPRASKEQFIADIRANIACFDNAVSLGQWWNSEKAKEERRSFGLDPSEVNALKAEVLARRDELTKEAA